MSVYRTIGPTLVCYLLIFFFNINFLKKLGPNQKWDQTVCNGYKQMCDTVKENVKAPLSKTKFLNGKISFIKRYLPHYNLCYMPLPPFQK